ncbi:MAG: hypothetical protein KJ915_06600 [Candidatus Omnitrophica bacterium]|nr:hypothetical protein [Candidatus Omnitrophota bacterium]
MISFISKIFYRNSIWFVKCVQTGISLFLIFGLLAGNVYAGNVMLTDKYTFWIISNALDEAAPIVQECSPQANASDISRSTNIKACIFDAQSDIDYTSIDMAVNGALIISNGIVQTYQDVSGNTLYYQVEIVEKTANDYVLMYDPVECFNYEENVRVTLNAADVKGNQINSYDYSFKIQNFQIGAVSSFFNAAPLNISLAAQTSDTGFMQDHSVIANSVDGKYVFIAWEQRSSTGIWDIYCVKSNDFGKTFSAPMRVNPDAAGAEQRSPSIALDGLNNAYISWQQKAVSGDWDIYIAKINSDETFFSTSKRIYADYNSTDQILPSITVGPALQSDGLSWTQEPSTVYAVWVESNGTASSVRYTRTTAAYNDAWDVFVSNSIRIDTARAQQCKDPIIKLDASARTFVAWRGDNANGTSSIYFDRANKNILDGKELFSTDITVSNSTSAGAKPELEVSADGNNVYLLWKERLSDQANLRFSYYRYLNGYYTLNASKVVNSDVLSEADLGEYDISIDIGNDVSVIWSEVHNNNRVINLAGATYNNYTFSEFASIATPGVQQNPCLGMDSVGGHYYMSWTDNSNGYDSVYFCRNTYIVTDEITAQKIDNSIGGIVAVSSGSIAGTKIEIAPDAIDAPITITIAESVGAPEPDNGLIRLGNVVDFGPGQTTFKTPARISLPYNNPNAIDDNLLNVYYYNIAALKWELVPGCAVDIANQMVSVNINHFSIYMVADGAITAENIDSTQSGGGGGGGCFIATAAFGTSTAEQVDALRKFRDQYLLTNKLGISFVQNYYKYSPPFADKIRNNDQIKVLIRVCLKPLISLSQSICR